MYPDLSAESDMISGAAPNAAPALSCSDDVIQTSSGNVMLKWALIFAVIAVVAGLFGFTGIAVGAASVAKLLFFVFVVLFVLALVLGATIFKKIVD